MDSSTGHFTQISLCTGYGGLDLAIGSIFPTRVLAYSEIEAYAVSNLLDKIKNGQLDSAPIWTDLRTFPASGFSGMVDVLCGGYPCQGFSQAGKRKGQKDERHLWPYIRKIIGNCKPKLCIFENVRGHVSLGFPKVVKDLQRLGYTVGAGIFTAQDVGAPHRRERLFIVAYADRSRLQRMWNERKIQKWKVATGHYGQDGTLLEWPERPGVSQKIWEASRVAEKGQLNPDFVEQIMGLEPGWTGTGSRIDRLRLLGNGVVPQQAEFAIRSIVEGLLKD